jgi:hypothetical protein
VLAAVHHAEVVAHRVGEPYGTLVLAIAITVIEVGLVVTLMLAGGPATAALARDTVFAAVMIILNGMLGICLLAGASRHRVQTFGVDGVSAALATLAAHRGPDAGAAETTQRRWPDRSTATGQLAFCRRRLPGALRHVRAGPGGAPSRLLPARGRAMPARDAHGTARLQSGSLCSALD